MPAPTNTATAAGMAAAGITAREIDFVSRFNDNWEALREVLGIVRPIRKTPGTRLTAVKASVTLADSVGEGETIANSQQTFTPVSFSDLTVEKYATQTTIEAVAKYGASIAIEKSDDAFRNQLQSLVLSRFYTFLQTGTLTSTEATFQMAVAMAIGKVADKFKTMKKGITGVNVWVNTLDAYRYLGAANVTIQNRFGIQYIEDFMGADRMILTSDIPQNKVIATAVDNVDLYYIDPGDSDFVQLGLQFTVQGETNLIGFHAEGDYSNATGKSYALMGMQLWAEYLDAVAVVTVDANPS